MFSRIYNTFYGVDSCHVLNHGNIDSKWVKQTNNFCLYCGVYQVVLCVDLTAVADCVA